MSFTVSQKTLERLEWERILGRLAESARTPGSRSRCAAPQAGPDAGASLFEATHDGVLERLEETSEARAILAAGSVPPMGDLVSLDGVLLRARKDGVLAARELLDLANTLHATRATRRFLTQRAETAPRLADLAELLVEHRELEDDIDDALEASGEVRDSASPALAAARRDSRRLAAEIQSKVEHYLRDESVTAHLSDVYYTVRNDRYVLPVRADSRGGLRGIVHDASNSGQTLFIEPEALVELNNRRKQAEIAIEQETLRVLRQLSRAAAAVVDEVETNTTVLEVIDLAFARGSLAEEYEAVAPEVGRDGVVRLRQLRHPLIGGDQVVPNDVRLGDDFTAMIISGPNAGGKTVTLKSIALAALLVRAGMHVPCAEDGARIDLFDEVLADIGDEQDIRERLSTFSAHMANLATITAGASSRSLVVLDEVGVGTDPGEGAAIAQAILEDLADKGARVVATTHYNLLKEMAEVDDRFANASVEFDENTLQPTYRLHLGLPGTSTATAVASRMGLSDAIIERATALLEREDRQLDSVLAELATSRAALETEQREIAQLRTETEAVRAEHREKLERLQARRDKLFLSMREELERSFRDAHEQVAGVIRELQRRGTAQDAARAREKLSRIATRARDAQKEAGLDAPVGESVEPMDWSRAAPGDPVVIADGGKGVLVALPDRRGRVAVRLGSARVLVPAERVGAGEGGGRRRSRVEVHVSRAATAVESDAHPDDAYSDDGRCNLHGLRAEEAVDRLMYALDRAASAGRHTLYINHGVGTGTLRRVVHEHLRGSPYIERFRSAAPDEGGDGVTVAFLR